MKINRIRIKKKGKLKDLDLTFGTPINKYYGDELNISVIVGENGTGKTTILRFLSQVFNPDKFKKELPREYIVSYQLNGFQNDISSTGGVHINGLQNNISSTKDVHINGLPTRVIVSTCSPFLQYKSVQKPYNLPVPYFLVGAGGIISRLTTVYLPIIGTYSMRDRKKAAAFEDLLSVLGYSRSPFIEIRANNSKLTEAAMYDETVSRLLNHYEEYKQTRLAEEKKRVKGMSIRNLELYEGGVEGWLNDVTYLRENMRISFINSLWFPKNDALVNMSNLSSGELSLFSRFFSLLEVIEDDSLVLIDEPETHLHPKWIQKFMVILREAFKSFRVHILIATHSPFIVYEVPKECIVSLTYNDQGRVQQVPISERTLGSAPMDVFQEIFNVKEYTGKLTESIYEKITKYINEGKLEKAELLYNDLGNSSRKYALFLLLEEAKGARGK